MTSFVSRLDRFPPAMCRLVARVGNGRRWMGLREIARRSGLSLTKVHRISKLKSWTSVGVGEMDAFTSACGVDLNRLRAVRQYLKRRKKVAWGTQRAVVASTLKSLISK